MLRKNLDLIIAGFLLTSLILFDTTLELVEELAHLTMEVLHNLFEVVELGVEEVVEHSFHFLEIGEIVEYLFITERHGSQVVTFYVLMAVIAYGAFRLARLLPSVYRFLKRGAQMSWIRRKTQCLLFWESLNYLQKVLLVSGGACTLLVASLFVI